MEDAQAPERTGFHKVTVNLIPQADTALTATAERLSLSRTDIINRALQAYDFFEKIIAEGDEVVIRHTDGSTERVKFL